MNGGVEIAAVVYRGKMIEAIHYASVAVVNERGELTHYLGDPDFTTMTRSCIKPFQLRPLVESGAADHFGFDNRQLAIMCGSHNGTDLHREAVMSNLSLAGNEPEHLLCGAHWPIGMEATRKFPQGGEEVDPVRHNCSGKHSGFLALARFLKENPDQYLNPQSETQKRVLSAVAGFCEYPVAKKDIGVDGCSAPNFPLSLRAVAHGFVKLATEQAVSDDGRVVTRRIKQSMLEHPEMVSGQGRFDLQLSNAYPGRLICKVGAEAIEGIALDDPPVGIAVKIHDGNWRALWPVCVEVLRQLGYNAVHESELRAFVRPEVRNVRNLVTGHIVPEFELHKV